MYLRAKSVQSPLLQCVLQRIHFIREDNVIFFKGVPNDDPIQDPETADNNSAAESVKSSTSCVEIERGSARLEDITYAANCVHEFLFEGIIDLGAQSANNHVNDISVCIEVDVPHVLGDFFARDNLADGAGQLS